MSRDALAFFSGSPAYNVVNLMVGTFSLFLTIVAMVAARRAENAATFAQHEVAKARRQMRNISAGVELGDLRGYLRETLVRLDASQFEAAIMCLDFVRTGLARAKSLPLGSKLATPAQWRTIDDTMAQIRNAIWEYKTMSLLPQSGTLDPIVRNLIEIGISVARMQAATEVEAVGDDNVTPT